MYILETPLESLQGHLRTQVPGLEPAGAGRWRFPVGGGRFGEVSVDDEWISVEAPVGRAESAETLWSCLASNRNLPGPVRFVFDPLHAAIARRADVPVDDGPSLYPRLARAITSCGSTRTSEDHQEMARDRVRSDLDLGGLCTEAGWNFTVCEGGGLRIPLAIAGSAYRVGLELWSGSAAASVEICSIECTADDRTRHALAVFLLTASGMLRLARPAVVDTEASISILFETLLHPDPDPADVNHALSALSAACMLCAAEAEVLKDARIAARFLEIQGWNVSFPGEIGNSGS